MLSHNTVIDRRLVPDDLLEFFEPAECGECYVCQMVAVFREVKRVLRRDGTVWLNLGDSYVNHSQPGGGDPTIGKRNVGTSKYTPTKVAGLKPKDLIGIPWRVAFALQADGWWLRQDIIWNKKNPIPESVRDRCTKSHEYLFMLTKSARYYYDHVAIKEEVTGGTHPKGPKNSPPKSSIHADSRMKVKNNASFTAAIPDVVSSRNKRSVWTIGTQAFPDAHFATFPEKLVEPCILAGTSEKGECPECGKPWVRVVEKKHYGSKADHSMRMESGMTRNNMGGQKFWNEEYIPPVTTGWSPQCSCNLMGHEYDPDDLEIIQTPTGSRVGDDPSMITGRAGMNRPRGECEGSRPITRYEQRKYAEQLRVSDHREQMAKESGSAFAHYIRTDRSGARPAPDALLDQWIERGWVERVQAPTITPMTPVPQTVLDPFIGSGTVAVVAERHGRNWIGIDLTYQDIAWRRIEKARDAPKKKQRKQKDKTTTPHDVQMSFMGDD